MSQVKLLEYRDGKLAYYMEHRQILENKILIALEWLAGGLVAQGWRNVKPPSELVEFVLDEFYLMTVGDTLVAFTVDTPWFMNGPIVDEEFIAPVSDNPAPIKLVVEALEAVCSATGSSMLSLGTRANPRQKGLARMFEQAGCKLATMGLVKEIP